MRFHELAVALAPAESLQRRFTSQDVRPPNEAVAVAVGYPPSEPPEVLLEAIEAVAARGEPLWSIQGGCFLYDDVSIDLHEQAIEARGIRFHTGRIVTGQLARSTSIGVFLCTAGPAIEELARNLLAAGDPFTGYVASALGSLVVEAATDRLQDAFRRWMADRGLLITNRYSPGYCGWHVAEQQRLFRLLPAGYCGVRLTDTSLMQPVKSVTGIIGVGARVRFNDYTCNLCDVDACLHRQAKTRRTTSSTRSHDNHPAHEWILGRG